MSPLWLLIPLWFIARSDLTSCRGYYFNFPDSTSTGGGFRRVKVCAPDTTMKFSRSTNSGDLRIRVWYIPVEGNPSRVVYERTNGQQVSIAAPYHISGAPTGYYLTRRMKGRDYGHEGIGRDNEYLIRSANSYSFQTLAEAELRANEIIDMINDEEDNPPEKPDPPSQPEKPGDPDPLPPPVDPNPPLDPLPDGGGMSPPPIGGGGSGNFGGYNFIDRKVPVDVSIKEPLNGFGGML